MESLPKRFGKSFTRQPPLPDAAIDAAVAVLHSGNLHRYHNDPDEQEQVSRLEEEFAGYIGRKYCLACASCGTALYLAMKAIGVTASDRILCNAFTLAPVPGAIQHTGARIELVEITDGLTIDLDDLNRRAAARDARWLLLSHMRGHIADMGQIARICQLQGLTLIEDCAHTMGATWDHRLSGSFGHVACFSTQTFKHLNSGEGGLLVTDDDELIARAILYSGSYMFFDRHLSRPDLNRFHSITTDIPNYSCRMDELRAAILRPQLQLLPEQCQRWNERYQILEVELNRCRWLRCPPRDSREGYVGSSIQFQFTKNANNFDLMKRFVEANHQRGVHLSWYGNDEPAGYASNFQSWSYLKQVPRLIRTRGILSNTFDMRIPLTFSTEDCLLIADIIREVAETA